MWEGGRGGWHSRPGPGEESGLPTAKHGAKVPESLADGDLTVQATVTEDITGAIADSVNFAIEQLREQIQNIE